MAVVRACCAPRALLAATRTSVPVRSINIPLQSLVVGTHSKHATPCRIPYPPLTMALRTSCPRAADVQAPTTQQVADDGDYVAVHYTGTLDDGTVFDSSRDREPLSFVLGAGTVVPGFDIAVKGLAVGGTRTQRVEPADAYGTRYRGFQY